MLWIVKELGLASLEEVNERLKELFKETYPHTNLVLRRWKARKVFSMEDGRYKIADVPAWFRSLSMDQLVMCSKADAKKWLKDLEELFSAGGEVGGGVKPKWRNFSLLELTFENVDPILGGRPKDGEVNTNEPTVFPREKGDFIVPIGWLKGWTRDNAPLLNITGSLSKHVAWGKGYWNQNGKKKIKPIILTAPVTARGKGVGISKYESIPEGNTFTVRVRFPMKGCVLRTPEDVQKWFDMIAETPIRGLGANPNAYGGRVKLINLEELN